LGVKLNPISFCHARLSWHLLRAGEETRGGAGYGQDDGSHENADGVDVCM